MPFAQGDIALGPGTPVLALRPRRDTDLGGLGDGLVCETGFKPDHDALALRHAAPPDIAAFAVAVLFVTRHRRQTLALVAGALQRLEPGGWLVIDGQKNDGIDSLLRQLRGTLEITGTISKAHGKVIWLQRPDPLPAALADWQTLGALTPNADGFLTAPGMFSPDAIDPGTRALADQFGPHMKGRAADLGAGWGAAAALLLQAAPDVTAVDLFEAEHAAIEAARENITDPRAAFHWADVTTLPVPEHPYDLIIANPPFHQGRAAEPNLGIAFIAAAARLLKPKGTAYFVANRQLPYEAAIDKYFRKRTEIALAPGYKVISASGPRPAKH